MHELTQDPFYELIDGKYHRCVIDYCLIAPDFPYREIRSHREAVLFALLKVIERYLAEQRASEEKLPDGVRNGFSGHLATLSKGKQRTHQAGLRKQAAGSKQPGRS